MKTNAVQGNLGEFLNKTYYLSMFAAQPKDLMLLS